MSEEEKEAIETLIEIREFSNLSSNLDTKIKQLNAIDTILNYIDKLQKENDFLKAPFEYANGNTLDKRYVEMNFISKAKIKAKINELEEIMKAICEEEDVDDYQCEEYYKIQVLEELLEK